MDLKRNLKLNGLDYGSIPLVLQYNKRDLPDIMEIGDLDAALNDRQVQTFAASAFRGTGVVETLKAVTMTVFKHVRDGGLANLGSSPSTSQARPSPAPVVTSSPQAVPLAVPSRPPAAVPTGVPANVAGALPRPPPASAPRVQPQAPPEALTNALASLVQNAEPGQAPMPSKDAIGMLEFQNLAVLHHRLAERVGQLEKELQRVSQEHQDLKRIVGKKLMGP
jgi:hypothetical protein